MNAALADVLRRRAELVARSRALRLSVALQSPGLARPLAWVDRVRAGVRWCAARPLVLGAGMTAITLLRPRRAVAWSTRAWAAWRLWRRLRPLLQSPWKPPAR